MKNHKNGCFLQKWPFFVFSSENAKNGFLQKWQKTPFLSIFSLFWVFAKNTKNAKNEQKSFGNRGVLGGRAEFARLQPRYFWTFTPPLGRTLNFGGHFFRKIFFEKCPSYWLLFFTKNEKKHDFSLFFRRKKGQKTLVKLIAFLAKKKVCKNRDFTWVKQ